MVWSKAARGALIGLTALAVLALAACGNGTSTTRPPAAQATAPTASPTAPSSVRYVAIGASDAVGLGASDPNTKAYVPIIISRLPRGSTALNLGINGEKVHEALRDELPQAVSARPTLVSVWMVGNDFLQCTPLDQYIADLNTLLGTLQNRTQAQVFVGNVPDMSQLPIVRQRGANIGPCLRDKSDSQIRAMVEQWNAAIAGVAARHNDVVVNLRPFPLGQHPEYISRDGLHPTDTGYRVLADYFWQAISARRAVPAA